MMLDTHHEPMGEPYSVRTTVSFRKYASTADCNSAVELKHLGNNTVGDCCSVGLVAGGSDRVGRGVGATDVD